MSTETDVPPMSSGEEVVELALRRRDILEALREPRDKRELVSGLEVSRSTVDRGIRELEVAGLVSWDCGNYRLTALGRTLSDAVGEVLAVGAGVRTIAERVGPPAGDLDLPPELLAASTIASAPGDDHRLPGTVRERLREATDLVMVCPAASAPALLACCREFTDAPIEVVLEASFVDELAERLPGIARWLAACERLQPFAVDGGVPPVAVVVADTDEEPVGLIVTHDDAEGVTGCIESTAPEAVEWGRELVAEAVDAAEPALEEVHVEVAAAPGTADALTRECVVELTPSYFAARKAAPLSTAWRAGLSLTEVAAGRAVERTLSVDGERRSLTDELLARLDDGVDVAVVGPPGSGKSTACKAVACEWYRERGPVFYRESGSGEPFESWPTFAERLRAAEGSALVVFEDAVRPEACDVFRLMKAFPDDVAFLLDARESEWTDPSAEALPDEFRTGVDVVSMPTLDERDTRRFVERVEAAVAGVGDDTGAAGGVGEDAGTVDVSAKTLLDDVDQADERPARLLCVLHRLSLLADPLGADGPTTLDEAVREVAAELRGAGDLADDAGILVTLCTVAGVEVTPDLVASLAPTDPDDVRAALDLLEGRVLFERPSGAGYRTVHEAWAGQYLRAAGDRDDIVERVGDCLGRLLALADDDEARRRIRETFDPATTVDRVEADPGEWADEAVERLFGAGVERPHLTPLFGESDPDPVEFPAACDPETVVAATERRAHMARLAGNLELAEREYERLADRAAARLDDDAATEYAAERDNGLGVVARKRSEYDVAADHFERAEERYAAVDDDPGVADARKNLGGIALMQGDLEAAERHLSWSYERFQELGDERLASYSLFNLAYAREERGDLEGAIERYRECLAAYRRFGSAMDEADVHLNLGVALLVRGDTDAAAGHYASALRIYREIGDELGVANALQNHGDVALQRGDLESAAEYYDRSRDRYVEVGEEWGQVQCQVALAEVALERGHAADAEQAASDGLDRLVDIGDCRGTMKARRIIAAAAREQGEYDRAEDHLETARETGRDGGFPRRTGGILAAYGDLERARDDHDAACERYAEAAELLEGSGALGDHLAVVRKLAEASEAAGDDHDAAAHRRRAAELRASADFEIEGADGRDPASTD